MILNDVWILLRGIVIKCKFIVLNFINHLILNLLFMLDQVDIMLLESFRNIKVYLNFASNRMLTLVIFLVLNCGDLMVSDQLSVLFFTHSEVVVAHSTFISDLLRDELWVVPGWNALINKLLLAFRNHKVSVYKLGHFYVVSENVEW